jgi:hemerythrin-like domain-containing protein
VIDRLTAEHVVIHDVLEQLDAALVRLIRQPRDFTSLDEAVAQLTDTLNSHLSYEEAELIEPMACYGLFRGQI